MFDSIRTKLTFWYVGVLALVVLAFSLSIYFVLVGFLNRDVNQRLAEMAVNFGVAATAELEDEANAAQSETALSEVMGEMRFRDYQFRVLSEDGRWVASNAELQVPSAYDPGRQAFVDIEINGETYRVYQSSLKIGRFEYRLLVYHSLKELKDLKSRLLWIFLIAIPLTLVMSGYGGYFLARRSLAPMVEMGRQAEKIGARNLSDRISIKNRNDELGDLAAVFNDLLERLDASFEQQRRFMADASHELRTPLAIVRGETEVALSKDRSTGEYQESLNVVFEESKRLTRIVEDLFMLARADAGQFNTNFAPVYLDEIAGDAVRSIRVLADRKQIDIRFTSDAEMPFEGDETLLRRLFLNLLDNALKYTMPGGRVLVACVSGRAAYYITVTDNGIGIPFDEQQNIFKRFYRVDKARTRVDGTDTPGSGLGLSISQWIAGIHKGKIELVSSDANGSVFSIEFVRPARLGEIAASK